MIHRERTSPADFTAKKLFLVLLALSLAFSAPGCKTSEYWTFGVTGSAFEGGFFKSSTGGHPALLVFLVVFVVLDIVFLPVAVPHDIWLHVSRGAPPEPEENQ